MLLKPLLIISFLTISLAFAEEVYYDPPVLPDEWVDRAEELAKDCSLESINKTYESGSNLRKFAKLEKKDLCKYMTVPSMVAKVDNKRKKAFERGELDKTIADKMKEDFNNLASQFIMFKNLLLKLKHI